MFCGWLGRCGRVWGWGFNIRGNGVKLAVARAAWDEHFGAEPSLEDEDAAEVDAMLETVAEDVGGGWGFKSEGTSTWMLRGFLFSRIQGKAAGQLVGQSGFDFLINLLQCIRCHG